MNGTTVLKALAVILLLLAPGAAFGLMECGTEICVELYGFNPITGAVITDIAVVPKGPIVSETAAFCLSLFQTFPEYPTPLQGVIGYHFWLAALPPGGTGDLEADLVFLGQLNGQLVNTKLPFPIAFYSYVPLQGADVDLICWPQDVINGVPSGTTYLFGGGYTVPPSLPVTLGGLLASSVGGPPTLFYLTIGD